MSTATCSGRSGAGRRQLRRGHVVHGHTARRRPDGDRMATVVLAYPSAGVPVRPGGRGARRRLAVDGRRAQDDRRRCLPRPAGRGTGQPGGHQCPARVDGYRGGAVRRGRPAGRGRRYAAFPAGRRTDVPRPDDGGFGCVTMTQAQCHRSGKSDQGQLDRPVYGVERTRLGATPLPTGGWDQVVSAATATDEARAAARRWVGRGFATADPYSIGESYQNWMDPALPDWKASYYAENYPRLARVKAAYDPHRFFAFAQGIGAGD